MAPDSHLPTTELQPGHICVFLVKSTKLYGTPILFLTRGEMQMKRSGYRGWIINGSLIQRFKVCCKVWSSQLLKPHYILHSLNSQLIKEDSGPGKASLVAQIIKNLPAMWDTWVHSLSREEPLEKRMAAHSSFLAWRIPWTEEPGGLQSMVLQKSQTQLSNWLQQRGPLNKSSSLP